VRQIAEMYQRLAKAAAEVASHVSPGDTAEAAGTAGRVSGPSAGLYLTEPARGLAGLAFLPLAEAVLDGLPRALAALAGRSGGPVSVVGWSLGGIYARELARQHPGRVRQVITLGSPFALTDPRQSRADGAYRRRRHLHADGTRVPTREQVARPISVPSTAVYSRRDGIVSWQTCVEPETAQHENAHFQQWQRSGPSHG
jgi:pimeloyl-ACP methyl ester carboxylesterase